MQRKMVSVKARVDRQAVTSSIQAGQMVRSLTRPSVSVTRTAISAGMQMEPLAIAEAIKGAKEQENKVDMSLEMVDVDALDTGKYRAMVIQDPNDKRMMKGFLHLGVVYCESIFATDRSPAQWNVVDYIHKVVDAMNEYTDIKTDLRGYYTFDSREMLKIPWVFINTNGVRFRLTHSEATNLGVYLTTGGFLFMEGTQAHAWGRPSGGMAYRHELVSGQNMLKDGLAIVGYRYGQEWTFENIPDDHPMYHCYFDFDGPLPSYWPDRVLIDEFMYGITIDGRLLVVFETGDYERFINDVGGSGARYRQFLVNVVVYALTQEGSFTHRLMDTVNH